jgi:hypothetical protein
MGSAGMVVSSQGADDCDKMTGNNRRSLGRQMPLLKNYKLFISHSWRYDDDYYRIEKWLNEAPLFAWTNLSVPRHDPILNSEQLAKELHNQMRPAGVFIILAGMYAARSDWIQYEINFARRIGRPILGI